MTTTISDIQVKVRMMDNPKLLAQATVVIFGIVEIHGWRVMPSTKVHPKFQEQLWIQPPVYKAGAGWKPIIWITDIELYTEIESLIYDTYLQAKVKTPPTTKDEVSIDDIPF